MKKKYAIAILLFFCFQATHAQTDPLIEKVSQKLALVNDYVAEGTMKNENNN
jgi:outer membrane lipoprotein-sorting protein